MDAMYYCTTNCNKFAISLCKIGVTKFFQTVCFKIAALHDKPMT